MRPPPIRTYLTPRAELIREVVWERVSGSDQLPLESHIPAWDPTATLEVIARVTLDAREICKDCQLRPDSKLRLSLTHYSTGTSLSRCIVSREISGSTPGSEFVLGGVVHGRTVLNRLDLEVTLSVDSATAERESPVAPTSRGLILWQESKSVQTGGAAMRFPVRPCSFVDAGLPPSARWVFEWAHSDLERQLLADAEILVNEDDPIVHAALITAGEHDILRQALSSQLAIDVARQLVTAFVREDGVSFEPSEHPSGSLGKYIARLIRTAFPSESAGAALKTLLAENPSRFELQLQHSVLAMLAARRH